MFHYIKDNSILIVPNSIKENTIKYIRDVNNKLNIKILSLSEFIKNMTYDYNEETIYNLMKMEDINYNIATLYLDNLKYIDETSESDKHKKLTNIKNMINDKLINNSLFKLLIKDKPIYIYGYDYITKYQKYILSNVYNISFIKKEYSDYKHKVYKFNTLENEVIFVAEKISELIYNGININKIYIANLDDNYTFAIHKIFKMYDIPVNLDNKVSLFETNIGKYFINNLSNNIESLLNKIKKEFNMINNYNNSIYLKLIDVINKFYFTEDYISIKDNIINVMKKTYIDSEKYKNAVNKLDIINNIITDDMYVFLVGFNLNKFPKTLKDEDYITDDIKPGYLEKSFEMNLINKEIYFKVISNIKNLTISYSEKHLNETLFPSLLIDEYNMEVCENIIKYSKYSDEINKILLAKSLDKLIKYNNYTDNLNILYNNYKIDYKTYDNKFKGINKNSLVEYLNGNFNLSYSSMDNYYHCAFKFYLSNILKLDYFESTIQIYIGNLYHYVLSKCFINDDIDSIIQEYIKNNEYPKSFKNEYFLSKIIDELKLVVNILKYQNTLMNMDEAFYEKKICVEKPGVININFKGFIDKLLKRDNNIVIIDYKTYSVEISLNYLPYGLSMQLPVYLYLTKNMDKDYKIIGLYLQQVLFNKNSTTHNKTLKEIKKGALKLKGYSLGDESILSNFDSTVNNSELIHGMKITDNGFGYYSKVLTEKQLNNIYDLTEKKIDECIDNIENANFTINPKKINGKNIGCNYCKFKDICFMTNKDITELDDIKDLSFLD